MGLAMICRNLDFLPARPSLGHHTVGGRQRYPLIIQLGTMGGGGGSLPPQRVHVLSNARPCEPCPSYACAPITYDRHLFLVGDHELAGSREDLARVKAR
jgi:hypothetical protein